jgi:hypothetical protein
MDFCSSGLVWDGQTLFDLQPMAGSHARIQPRRTRRLPLYCSWRRSFHSLLPTKEGTIPPRPSSYRH